MRRARLGMVMIEFTLAAVGIVAMAFMTVRVGQWLNDSMVERNASFQASRPLAGRGPGVTPYAGVGTPTPLHLIGPRASQTPGQGTPGGGQSATRPTCGDDLLSQANVKRWQVVNLLSNGQAFTLPEQSEITRINNIDWNMLVEANYLAWNAIQIDNMRKDLLDRIYPRLREIQNMEIVQGVGPHDICAFSTNNPVAGHDLCPLQEPKGIHQIDERLAGIIHEIDPTAAGTVGFERAAWYARLQEIANELNPWNVGSLGWRRAATYAALLLAQAACDSASGGIVSGGPWTITSCFTDTRGGIDIAADSGTDVQAFRGGTVYSFCSTCGDNNYVTIDHGDGSYTSYAHLQNMDPSITWGSAVSGGQVLGEVGDSGLHYGRLIYTDWFGTVQVDPLGGQTCEAGTTTSDALASPESVGVCANADSLRDQLAGITSDWDALVAEQTDIYTNELPPLDTLYNYLAGEMYGLLALHYEVNGGWGLQAQQYGYLDWVDAIVDSWTPLWQQLHPCTELWDQDLSDLFQQTIQAWDDANANSLETVLLDLTAQLDAIIGRLLEMMLERLDHIDWSELPWFMGSTDYIGRIPQSLLDRFGSRLPLVTDDNVNPGGQREANARIPLLMAYNERIRTLILEAEELERQARRDCTSETP